MRDSLVGSPSVSIADALQPVRRRMGLVRMRTWAIRGLAAGGVAAIALLALLAAFGAPTRSLPAALAVAALGAVAGAAYGASRWPSDMDAARAADRHFELRDRLTTALEYRSSADPFFGLQRADAARRISGLPLAQGGRAPVNRREAILAAAILVAFVAVLLIGESAPATVGGAAARDQRRIHVVAAKRVPQIAHNLESGLTPASAQNPALRKLALALARLRQQLEHAITHAITRASALRAISASQQELHRLAASLHPVNRNAVAQLNSSLSQYMTPRQRAAVAASDRKALAAAAQMLRQLAQRLAHMSPAQRAQLAQRLAQAANATNDSRMQSSLRQAASSLGYNDPQTAAQSLREAASQLSQTPGQQAARSRLNAATRQLDSLKNDVSGLNSDTGERTASGQQGAGGGTKPGSGGKGAGHGGSKGSFGRGGSGGKGAGRGTGKGATAGAGAGSSASSLGTGAGHGEGSAGNHGSGGGQGSRGNNGQGRYATVYAPYRQGKGPRTIESGPSGAPQAGPIVPYRQVLGQYGQTAHEALDHANLPPDLRSYVRRYFSTVSH